MDMANRKRMGIRQVCLIGILALVISFLLLALDTTQTSHGVASGQTYASDFPDTLTNTPTSTPVPIYCGPAINFVLAGTYPAGADAWSASTGDFNNDGHPDFMVADQGAYDLAEFLGNGDGTFQS